LKSIEEYKNILGDQSAGIQDLQQLFTYAQYYQISDWIEFNPTIVRGLAYYTGIVFEGFDRDRQLRAIFGGGRYDHLIASFSNPTATTSSTTPASSNSIPAVGFGFGDAVIVELLKSKQLLPTALQTQEIDIVAYGMDATAKALLYPLLQEIRRDFPALSIDVILEDRKVKGVFQKANKVSAKYVLLVGEDEVKDQVITIKNMVTSEQQRIPVQNIKKVLVEQLVKG
jgi:histidyl-tRNA synthetase